MGDIFASAESITECYSIIIITCFTFDSFVYIIRVGLWFCVCVCVCVCARARQAIECLCMYVCMYICILVTLVTEDSIYSTPIIFFTDSIHFMGIYFNTQ
jgi:hypothetical protein